MTQLSKSNKFLNDGILAFSQAAIVNKPYSETTDNIQISVWPEFIDNKTSPAGDIFIWAYHVRIENHGSEPISLINRYWRIIDETGVIQEVKGEGVVGEKPTIEAGSFYQYSSGTHLRYGSGIMMGHYQMQKTSGEIFNAKIPTFSLDSPDIKASIN
jgi:ApaG protein